MSHALKNKNLKVNDAYHWLNKSLHWITVLLILLVYCSAFYRGKFTSQTESANWYALVIHMHLGLWIFILTCITLIVNLKIAKPGHDYLSKISRISSKLMHYCLYFILIFMPLAAYIGTGFDFPLWSYKFTLPGFKRFELPQQMLDYLGINYISFTDFFNSFHQSWGADYLLPLLLIGHILAALYHHCILRDVTLRRIWF